MVEELKKTGTNLFLEVLVEAALAGKAVDIDPV